MLHMFIIMMSKAELPHARNYKLSLHCAGSLKLDFFVYRRQVNIDTSKFEMPGMIQTLSI